MHDAPVVILKAVVGHVTPVILVEVIFVVFLNIVTVNLHMVVTIGSRLLMMEADRVAQLVYNNVMLKGRGSCQ